MGVCTVYAFAISAFLIQPLFIPVPGAIYVVSYGWINLLGSKALQLCVYAFLILLVAHVVAVGMCVLYQYAQVTTFRHIKMIFQSRRSMTATYMVITTFYSVSFIVPVSMSDQVVVDPKNFSVTAAEASIEPILRHARGVHLFLLPDSQLRVVFIAYILVSVPFMTSLAYICWRVYYTVYNWSGFRSSRTSQMQFALFKSVTAQSAAVTLLYVIPVYFLAWMIYKNPPYAQAASIFIDYIMASYGPVNYILIFVYIGPLRRELTDQLTRLAVKMDCRTRKSSVILHLNSTTIS